MVIEEALLGGQVGGLAKGAGNQSRHHLAQRRHVVFRLVHVIGAGDAQAAHVDAQFGQRLFVEKSGEVVGRKRQQLAPADTDEEVLVFVADLFGSRGPRRRGQGAQRLAKVAVAAALRFATTALASVTTLTIGLKWSVPLRESSEQICV